IPETVARATARACSLGAKLLTVHVAGGRAMMEAAVRAARTAGGDTRLLGITVLTSLDESDLRETGVTAGSVESVVLDRARLARESGLDGVVASPREAQPIRRQAPPEFAVVTPGIRPAGGAEGDQKRIATPRSAVAAGADWIVVGRPIRDAADPRAMAEAIIADLQGISG
ncbi:MAG: orotidine-5'-phosphate decarboxylase, partial [Pseudomonadota bacterium]